jgi:DNA polymerase-3 subunit chi
LYGDGPEPAPPIQIGFDVVPEKHRNVLINLNSEIPAFHTQFSRIVELIINNETAQEAGRLRYRMYRSNRCEMSVYRLDPAHKAQDEINPAHKAQDDLESVE